MDIFTSFIQILLPGGLVLMGMYLTVKALIEKDYQAKLLQTQAANKAEVLPLRLQAYERMALLLERTSPHTLVMRVNNAMYNTAQFQQQLVHEIREELNHNLSQQIYVSAEVWALTRQAIEETISIINSASQGVQPEAPAVVLARAIFEQLIQKQQAPNEAALRHLKEEVAQLF